MYCSQCGSNNKDDARFCNGCGLDLANQTPPEKKYGHDSLDDAETSIQQDDPSDSFEVGSLFANRYEILDEGKRGGMGAVYKCRDTKLSITVALKIIHPRLLSSRNALSRFRQEVAISLKLQHPGIVRVFNLEEWEGNEYFTMEWVEGVTLRDIIQDRKKEYKPFSLEEAHKIISQLSDALSYAHQFTVHRDIKPENILIEAVSEGIKIKLTDFGIAKMLSPSEFTSTSIQMGTPYYMAPEQKVDAATVDQRADVYACGVILFELLTLINTIGLKLPSEINKNIPKETDGILKKALETEPPDRYDDIKELSDAVNEIVKKNDERLKEERERDEKEKRAREEERKKEEEQRSKKEEEKKHEEEKGKKEEARNRGEEGARAKDRKKENKNNYTFISFMYV